MNNQKRTEKRKIGDLGEDVACKFLTKQGFSIVDRNYLKKWGEIDIVAKKKGITHFVEVKTVTRLPAEVSTQAGENINAVTRETGGYRPEENVHPRKLARMRRVIQSYLLEKDIEEGNWQFDVVTVLLDITNREAKCEYLENIICEKN